VRVSKDSPYMKSGTNLSVDTAADEATPDWHLVQQSVIDEATDQWRKRLKACVKTNERHLEHLL